MRYLFLLLLLSFLPITQPALAQQGPEQTADAQTTVTLTIKTGLQPAGEHLPQLPIDIMEQLSAQDALANLELRAVEGSQVQVSARFVFPSMNAFTSWHGSENTQKLMRGLEGSDRSFSYTVSVNRHPLQHPSENGQDR